jgi:hypothetical protein
MGPETPEHGATPEAGGPPEGPEAPEAGERPPLDEAAVHRRVFLVRLAAWGTVLILAVVAFNLRAGASPATDHGANGPQVNGRTSQGRPIWAVMEGDRVREIDITWGFTCDNGGELEPWGGTFRDSTDEFDWNGNEFSFEDRAELPPNESGWVTHVKVDVRGRGEDGRASGDSGAVMWWERDGERGTVCRSGRVTWSIP